MFIVGVGGYSLYSDKPGTKVFYYVTDVSQYERVSATVSYFVN